MFNEKQLDDVIENRRADVAVEMIEQWTKLLDAEDKQDEFYKNASMATLFDLTVNGDAEACAYYVRKRLWQNELTPNDIKYLEAAVKNLNFMAALVGGYIFGLKNGAYKDTEKEFFCYAVLEQYGNRDGHKRISKAYKKNKQLIDKIDDAVLASNLGRWAVETLHGDKYYGFTVNVDPADKTIGLPDYKNARVMEIYLTHENGRDTDPDVLYAAYTRDGNDGERVTRLGNAIFENLSAISEKMNLKAGDIFIEGRHSFHYGAMTAAKANKVNDAVKIVSDADLNINVSEGRLSKSEVCAYCGGALDEDGVCRFCGKTSVAKDGGIVIRRGKAVEALLCTQCASPVIPDADGTTAVCPACGTTFIINGNSLSGSVVGLNYEDIRADMPEDEKLPEVEFVRASIAEGAVTAVMPRNFIVMSDEMRRIKYPVNAPKYIYTTPDSTVNLNMNFVGALKESDVFAFGQQMLTLLKGAYPAAKFGEAKRLVSPRNIFYVDFLTQAIDQTIYNAMFFFSYDGKQGIGSWNCLGKDRWFWSQIFEHAVKTMEFKTA